MMPMRILTGFGVIFTIYLLCMLVGTGVARVFRIWMTGPGSVLVLGAACLTGVFFVISVSYIIGTFVWRGE